MGGDINWVRGYLHLPRSELLPLFSILESNPDVTSPWALTPAAKRSLHLVEEALSRAQLNRYDPSLPISLCILKTRHSPTGVLWQDGPLWWLHGNSVGMRTLNYYPALVALQAMIGIKFCLTSFAKTPDKLIIPYTKDQVEVLAATVDDWAVLLCSFSNIIYNHFPKHPLLSFVDDNLVYFPKVTSPVPLVGAVTIFTDGSKTGKGAMVVGHQPPQVFSFQPDTPQATECLVVLEVFKKFSEPFNLFSDSPVCG